MFTVTVVGLRTFDFATPLAARQFLARNRYQPTGGVDDFGGHVWEREDGSTTCSVHGAVFVGQANWPAHEPLQPSQLLREVA